MRRWEQSLWLMKINFFLHWCWYINFFFTPLSSTMNWRSVPPNFCNDFCMTTTASCTRGTYTKQFIVSFEWRNKINFFKQNKQNTNFVVVASKRNLQRAKQHRHCAQLGEKLQRGGGRRQTLWDGRRQERPQRLLQLGRGDDAEVGGWRRALHVYRRMTELRWVQYRRTRTFSNFSIK